jgi:Flp pilus assembly pilin Flp
VFSKVRKILKTINGKKGQGMVEISLILGFVSIAAIAFLSNISDWLQSTFHQILTTLAIFGGS